MYEIRATWDLLNLNMSTCLTPSCLINWVECNLVWNHMGHLKIKQACKASFIWNLKGVLKLNYEVELPLYYIHFEITKFSGSDTGFLVYTNIESWTVYKRWVTKSWPAMESTSSMKPLPQSWPGPPKNHREGCESCFENWTSLYRS